MIIRTDGSVSLGGGHVIRSEALAVAMQSRGWTCKFAAKSATLDIFPHLVRDYDCLRLDCAADDEPIVLRESHPAQASLLVVDHPERGRAFEAACRGWAARVLSIDGSLRSHDCDLLVDPLPDRNSADYNALVPPTSVLLLGPQYAPLRSSFADLREASLTRRAGLRPVERIVVVCGATDAANQAVSLLRALDDSSLPASVQVVVPAGPHRRDDVEKFASRSRVSVDVRDWVPNPAALFAESDLALVCGGSVCWELCALGVPTIVVAIAANQRFVANALHRHGAALVGSRCDAVDSAQVTSAVDRLVNDALLRRNISRAAARLCDGRGADRVARAVTETAH